MTDLQPCLSVVDQALAEAEILLVRLADLPVALEPEREATRRRIAILRREVERLRGMVTPPLRTAVDPDWMKSPSKTPWCGEDV